MKQTFADKLSEEERIARAKALAGKLVDHTRALFTTAENNKIVLYSDMLSQQIPRSYAANAFNEMQRSMQFYFLVRLSALWDKPSNDRESLPSLIALISHPTIRKKLAQDTYDYHANASEPRRLTPITDPEEEKVLRDWWLDYRIRRAKTEKSKVERWLNFAIRVVPRVDHAFVGPVLRPFRDSYIAHNLDVAVVDKGQPKKLQYGDEAKLLRLTTRIVDRLHLALNGASFDWEGAQEHALRNAHDLWSSCRFELSTS